MARKLTLVAGSGSLVPLIAEAARRTPGALQVIDLVGRGDIAGDRTEQIHLSEADRLIAAVKSFGTTHLVLVGGVKISDADREGIAKAFGFAGQVARSLGDIGFAGMVLIYCKMIGVKLVGAHEIAPDLLAPEGLIAGAEPSTAVQESARLALRAAKAIGEIDLGQSIVFSGERAIAAEDAAGTDALLERVAALRASGLAGNGSTPLILAKAVKPRQPRFADLPAIGPQTVVNAAGAGISIIAIEAKRTLLIGRAELQREATARGVSVIGLRHG